MKLSKEEIISLVGMWLIVTLTITLYVKYHNSLENIGRTVVFMSPIFFFGLVGISIFNRDRKIIKKAKEKEREGEGGFSKTIELNWGQAMKHDLLTYLVPITILAMPLLFNQQPDLINLLGAILAYLILIYLKFMYWKEI